MRPVVAVTVADCDTTRPLVVSPVSAQLVLITVHRGRGTLTLTVYRSAVARNVSWGPRLPCPIVDPTQPNPTTKNRKISTQPNPTHGLTEPMDQGRGRGGRRPPLFSTGGTRPHPPTFCTEIRAKVSPLLQLNGYLLKRSVR